LPQYTRGGGLPENFSCSTCSIIADVVPSLSTSPKTADSPTFMKFRRRNVGQGTGNRLHSTGARVGGNQGTTVHGAAHSIVLDLNGDGLEIIERSRSHVTFDFNEDGKPEHTA
jgi:hypothetical protein